MALFLESPGHGSRQINALVLLLVCIGLVFSLVWQGLSAGYACPLCTLQRMALVLAGVGLLLNVRLGPSPLHYAMTITSALAGLAISGWLTLLLPTESGGRFLMGLRLHSWAFLVFGVLVAFALLMQTLDRRWGDNALKRTTSLLGTIVMGLFLVTALASALGTSMDCGVSACLKSLATTL
ncbi:disulfide bond formation protein B [Bordetella sp. FB-8]|uniref:disulfide bond formation protein B n=1 Tax=Bordetella sp. FB-8 TaxID=1159870 RepID=UPI00037F3A15|nr:disulfide bond formation protein B [Bordetella sp. FB-8]